MRVQPTNGSPPFYELHYGDVVQTPFHTYLVACGALKAILVDLADGEVQVLEVPNTSSPAQLAAAVQRWCARPVRFCDAVCVLNGDKK